MVSDPQASLAVSTNGDHDIKTHMTIKYSLEKCKILIKSRSPHQTAFQVIIEVAKTHPKRQQVPQKHSLKHDFLKVLCVTRRGDVPCSGRGGECGRGRCHFPSPGSGWTRVDADANLQVKRLKLRELRTTCEAGSVACLPLQTASGLAGVPVRPVAGGVWSNSRPLARMTLCGSCACPSSEIKAAGLSLSALPYDSLLDALRRSALACSQVCVHSDPFSGLGCHLES